MSSQSLSQRKKDHMLRIIPLINGFYDPNARCVEYKYIVARVINPDTQVCVIRVAKTQDVEFHQVIADGLARELKRSGHYLRMSVLGGGMIMDHPLSENTLCVFGLSGDFGRDPDRAFTMDAIRTIVPNRTISDIDPQPK